MRMIRTISLLVAFLAAASLFAQTRAKVMQNAKSFSEFTWTAPKGLSACKDKKIETPFTQGKKVKGLAYAWGAGHTLAQFSDAIKKGGYAGNNCTSDRGNPTYTSGTYGVDCSGLVTRVWERSETHLGTGELPRITRAVRGGYANMRSGDIFLLEGSHTALYSHRDPSGEIGIVEASSTDWKVTARTRPLSYFNGQKKKYTANRYPSLQDAGIAKITSGITAPGSLKKEQTLSVSFGLTETDGEKIRYDKITVAVLSSSGAFLFDLTQRTNVAINGDGTYNYSGTAKANLIPGKYKLVARGNIGGTANDWSDLLVQGSGKNNVTFTVTN